MLIGEVIAIFLQYIRNDPHAPERVEFTHILVDEYQDLNRAEQELISKRHP
jgi:superfamily I DNA/RNA helicase